MSADITAGVEPHRQFIIWHSWIPLSGMPGAVNLGTASAADWLVAQNLILQDHRTEGLRRDRCGDGLLSFRWRQAALARVTGIPERTLRRVLSRIGAGRWLDYAPGRGGRKSIFTVNREVMRELYEFHAPRAPSSACGLQDLPNEDERTAQPRLIYGTDAGLVPPVVIGGMDVIRLWRRRLRRPTFADLGEVRHILGLP